MHLSNSLPFPKTTSNRRRKQTPPAATPIPPLEAPAIESAAPPESLPNKKATARGKAAQVRNLPEILQGNFCRAAELFGMTNSRAIQHVARRFVREARDRFGEDLFEALTGEEEEVLEAVAKRGACNPEDVAEITGLSAQEAERLLERLVKYKRLRREVGSVVRGPKPVRYFPAK